MKKLLGIVVLGLLWCNTLPAKIIKLNQEIFLDVPETHNLMKFDDDESSENLLYGAGELFNSLD